MGRPATYPDKTKVAVCGRTAKTRLQERSERRAIVDRVIHCGGRTTLSALDKHFGYDVRPKALSLIKAGWLEVLE